MKLHFPDTSALNDLADSGPALVRHRLIDEVKAGRIVLLGTAPLILELNGTRAVNPAKHVAMVDLFRTISGGSNLLADPPTRRERELRKGGALTYPEFVESGFEPSLDPVAVDRAAAYHAGYARGARLAEAQKATEAEEALDARDPSWRKKLKEAHRNDKYVLDLAEDYARIAMEDFGKRVGISLTSSLNPRAHPTFWQSALIHVARIRAVLVGRTSPTGNKSPGQLDLLHLEEAASYADVFITSDGRLRSFAKDVRELGCEVVSYAEWAATLTA